MSAELEALGQQVLDALLTTYDPDGDVRLALAVHPGQVVADRLVQDGVPNEARINEWLSSDYDAPMLLLPATTTSVASTGLSGRTAKSLYADIAENARPALPTDAPAYARVEQLIAAADRAMGENKAAATLGVEPGDFADPASTSWQVFHSSVSSRTTRTVEAPEPTAAAPVINPDLWRMRPIDAALLATVHLDVEAAPMVPTESVVVEPLRVEPPPAVEPEEVQPVVGEPEPIIDAIAGPVAMVLQEQPSRKARFAVSRLKLDPAVLRQVATEVAPVEPSVPEPDAEVAPPRVLHDLVVSKRALQMVHLVGIEELADQPAVEQTTTQGSELTVHFEYCRLRITRRLFGISWWSDDLLLEDDWYVPGLRRGELVPEAAEGSGMGTFLPQALLAVRNVSITGEWTREAQEAFSQGASFVGPFVVQPAGDVQVSTGESVTVSLLGVGTQVIGELCSPLPVLPPRSDPALEDEVPAPEG